MPGTPTLPKNGSQVITQGVRVMAVPKYDADQSNPGSRTWVFRYRIDIINESADVVTLLRRRWIIVDALGASHEVSGDGVIGKTPRLEPGGRFGYESYSPLKTPWGTMEGTYRFRRGADDEFEVAIGRFYLVS